MKRQKNNRRNKVANRRKQKAASLSRRRMASLERLDERVLLDADGLAITSPAAHSIRGGETDVTNVTTDDPAATFTISGGADAALFGIDLNSGLLTFNSPPDFASPADVGADNVYDVTVRAEDNFSHVVDQPMAVTVLPANVAPDLTAETFSVTENHLIIGTATATDANTSDAGGDTLTFSFANAADAETFHLDAVTGELSYVLPPDFEAGNNSPNVDITVTDASGLSDTETFSILVSNVDEPAVTNTGNVIFAVGVPATNVGNWSHPTGAEVTLYANEGAVTKNGDGSWNWAGVAPSGPSEVRFVTIGAVDAVGQVATTTFSVSGKNSAPILTMDNATVTVDEGDMANNIGTFVDLDGDAVMVSSSVGDVVGQGGGTWAWSYPTTDGPAESQYVAIIATDAMGSSRAMSFQLVVQNVAPTVEVDQAAITFAEGETAENTGTFADAGDDIVNVTADIGSVTTNPDGTWDWTYVAPNGPATETVTVTATDSDGAQATETFDLSITNVAPVVAADVPSVTVNEGDTATVTGTITDQAVPADPVTLSASIGTITQNAGTWTWTFASTDGADESGTVTITADDGEGGISTTTFDLVVDNVAPAIAAASPTVTVSEGATATNSGTISDVGDDTVTLTVDRGTVVDNGDGTWGWSFATQDGPDESGPVVITATDSDGAQSTVQFDLVVNNTPPTIAIDGVPGTVTITVPEGDTATFTGTYAEAGPGDAVVLSASIGTIVDNGDDTWFWSFDSTDGADETQTVTVTITDSEGDQGTATFDLAVNNVAPTIVVSETNVVVDEGNTATNTVTITDPGVDTIQSLTATIGTATDNGDGTWNWSYLAPDGPNTETVTLTATDSDGAATTLDFTLQTENVIPVVAAGVPTVTINEGETATVTGTMSDQAVPPDSITLTSSLDGNGATITPGSGTWSWSYLAPDGDGTPETVTVSAADADGGMSDTTFELVVNNLPTDLTIVNSTVTVDEGQTAANNGTFSDPGVDAVTLSASFGTVVDDGNGDWSWSYLTTDGPLESQVVEITATDSDGAVSMVSFDLTVNNVAPAIAADNVTVSVTEGQTANNTGLFADVGSDVLTLVADRGTVVDNGNGTWNWSLATTDGPDETGDVTITVTDADGATTDVTFGLTVDNVAPTIAADLATVTVNESETATMTGTFADVGADTVGLTASVGTITNNGDGTWAWNFDSTDGPDQTQTVTVTATDSDGVPTNATFDLVVQNVAPTVAAATATVTVSEGQTATNSGTYADVGDDTVSVAADVGTATSNGDGTWSWSFDPTDGPEDTQTVTVTATDADGAQTTTTFDLVVDNAPGVLVVDNATVTVGEGTTATNAGSVTDAGDDAATLTASVGTVTLLPDGTTWNWSLATTDGTDDSQVVTITSTDEDGAVSTITFDLVVDNLPGTITVDNPTVTVSEGATATNSGTHADPGDDTVTFAASIGTVTDNGDGTWSWSFVTTDGETESQTVTITSTDSDGAEATTTFQLTVQNVDPTLTVDNATVTVSEGAVAGNSGTFGDIGDDTVSISADVGTVTLDAQNGTWQWSFQTTDGLDDSQTVTLTATDEDGGSVTAQFSLVVNNAPPVVGTDNANVDVDEGITATNTGTFSDAGGDPVTIMASSGSVTQDDQAGTWSWSLPTTDGTDDSRVVTVTATDEDGAVSTTTFQLNVANAAPTGTVANTTVTVNEGDATSNSGTFADAGDDDVTITTSVGTVTQDDQAGTWDWSYSSTDGPDEAQQVDITATDSDGGQTIISFQLDVVNVAPTVAADNGAVSVNEGTTATNTGTMADVGNDTITLSASVGTVVDNGDGTWSWSFPATDGTEQTQVVSITATDEDGSQTTTTFALVVSNEAPTIAADNASVITTEGAVATNTGMFDDVGDDTLTLSASVGAVVDNGNGTWGWSWLSSDGPADTGAATITATDSDGASASVTFLVQVDNVAPTLTVGSSEVTVAEGATAGNSGSMGDVGADTLTIAASLGTVVDNGNGTWNWSYDAIDGPDSATVTISATDSDGGSTSVDFDLIVDNADPTITVANDHVTVTENDLAFNGGTFDDPGDDTLTLSASVGTVADNGDGTWGWSFDTSDGPDDSQVVSITVEDSDGATVVDTFQLTVENAAPTLTVDNASVSTTEGSSVSNTGSISDVGVDGTTLTASIGTITQNLGVWTWTYDSTDGPDNGQTVTITATDTDGATADVTFELVVDNVAPVVTADNAALTGTEGSQITNTGSFSDIGADTVGITVDVGIVTQDNQAGTWTWEWTPPNGPAVQTVTVTATDSDGLATTVAFDVTVNNAEPVITSDNATVTVSENAVATNSGTAIDPSEDTLTLTPSVGTVTLNPDGTWQWEYLAVDGPDQQTVTITIADGDGGVKQTMFDLIVNNVPPVVAADNAIVTINEAGTASNSGTFMDVGTNDVVTLTASLGTIVDNGNGTWNWNHVPADGPDDSATVTVTATDSNNDQSSVQFDLVVNNAAPQIAADQTVVLGLEGDTATNTGTFSDPGVDDVTLSVSVGQVTDNGDGTWSWSYDSSDGPEDSQTVVVTATDSDNAVSTVEFDLSIENAAPTVGADVSPVTATEGAAVSNTGTYADPGNDDVTLSVSIGTLTDNGNGTWSWSHTPTDGPSDSQTVTVTATDSDGAVSTVDFPMTVDNVPPAITVSAASVNASENVETTNTGTFSDVGSDVVQLSASHGSVTDNGDGTWSWAYTPADGPDTISVSVVATDGDGGEATAVFDVTVVNVAPTLTVANSDVTATQGVVVANGGTFGDTPADDVTLTASLGQVVDNGDGTWGWTTDTTNSPAGVNVVNVTATDSDGESTDLSFNLTIENAPPVVTVNNESVNTPEGSTASNSGTMTDPGNDTMTIAASAGTVVDNGDGTWSWSAPTTDGPDNSDTITITATDVHGDSTSVTFQSIVDNVAPTVGADNATVTVSEGDNAANTGSYADIGADVVTLSASLGSVTDNGDGTWSWSHVAGDGPSETQTVTITATDSDQLDSTTTFQLDVFNVPPVIDVANETVVTNEGETANNSGSFSDAGLDTLSLSASIGQVVDAGNGAWTWFYTPADGPDESQVVTITVDDEDGGVNAVTFQLDVNNVAATLEADQVVVNVGEGDQATNTGTFSDPGTDVVSIAASLGSVTVDQQLGTWAWSYVPSDGPTSHTVTLTATDSDGLESTTTFALDVFNVDPFIDVANETVSADEGGAATNSGLFGDPGSADTLTLSATIGQVLDDDRGGWSWSYSPVDGPDESQTVGVTVDDGDGGISTISFDLVVDNVAPTVAADQATVAVDEETEATNSGTFTDQGADVVAITASIGTVTVDEQLGTWSWSYLPSNGPETQTVVITGTDSDQLASTATFQLEVFNIPPVINVNSPAVTVDEGDTATNGGSFGDVPADTVAFSASVGEVVDAGDGSWSWSYTPTDGPEESQTVTVTADDGDGGFNAVTFDLTVNNVAATVEVDQPVVVVGEGQEGTNTGTFSDPGSDEVTISASLGTVVVDDELGTWTWSYTPADGPDVQTVTITATDGDQAQSTTTFEVEVFNVLPDIQVDTPVVSVAEGVTATNSGSFGDVGTDALVLSASVGEILDAGDGTWAWSYTTADGPEDTQTVTLTVDDGDEGVKSVTFQLEVSNAAVVLDADQEIVNAQEGQDATNTGTFNDPGTDVVTITASVGTVVVDEQLGTWSWQFSTTDDSDSQTVTLTATDSDGEETTTTFALEVANADPLVTANLAEVVVDEGQTGSNSGTFSDVAADTVTLTASIGSVSDNGSGGWIWTHTPDGGASDSQTVTITATDEDGGSGTATFDFVVVNIPPAISVNNSSVQVFEGDTAANGGDFFDTSMGPVALTASVGTVVDDGDGTWSWSFTTSDGPAESQTVTVTATDSDGASTARTFELNVINVAPLIEVTNPLVPVALSGTASNSGTWGELGSDVVALNATVGEVTQNPDGTWDWQLSDVQNSQAVTIEATDSDGGFRSRTFNLLVQSPTLSVNGSAAVIVGTDLDDDFVVTIGSAIHTVTVSGLTFEVDATAVSALHIGGGFGEDTIQVNGTSAMETVSANANRVTINGGSYSVDTYDIDSVTFDGVSGGDFADLIGSTGVDQVDGALGDITMTTPNFSYRMINLTRVNAYGTAGADVANIQGSESNEFFASLPDHSYIENPVEGTKNYIKGFEQITVDGLGSTDYLYVADSPSDDQLIRNETNTQLVTSDRNLTILNFEVSTFEANNGGNDVATYNLTSPSDHLFVSTPTEAKLTQGAITSRVLGYETVQALVTGSGSNSARVEQVAAVETLFASGSQATMPTRGLTLDGFDDVVAEALAGESPTLDADLTVEFALDVIGDWV